jgi:hypothetical protein
MTLIFKFIKKFTYFVERVRPKPFKYVQKKLHIDEEWNELKNNLRPHKKKLYLMFGITLIPFSSNILALSISIQ